MVRRIAVLLLASIPLFPLAAHALTLRDIVELSKAGLSDDVLLALIEVDRPVFTLDSETIRSLKGQGVSERVMIAMIRSGRTPSPEPAAAAVAPEPVPATPPVVIVEHHEPRVEIREVAVPVPIYVPVTTGRRRDLHERNTVRSVSAGSPYYAGQVPLPEPPRRKEPVYWGWGGKLRPDAWKPAEETPARKPIK